MNCRFKGLHTPYWDKKLGEYFMPITVKSTTRIGLNYEHLVADLVMLDLARGYIASVVVPDCH